MSRTRLCICCFHCLWFALTVSSCRNNTKIIDLTPIDNSLDASDTDEDAGITYDKAATFTVNTSVIEENDVKIESFPLLIRLDETNFNFESADENGGNIAFLSENKDVLAHQIETWDKAKRQAVIWVLFETISNEAQLIFHLVIDRQNSIRNEAPVFSQKGKFGFVFHLSEVGNNLFGGYRDSSENGYHGSGVNMIPSSQIQGIAGFGQLFDGTSYISAPKTLDNPQSVMLSFWFSLADTSGDIVSMGDSVLVRYDVKSSQIIGMFYDGTDWMPTSVKLSTTDTWHHAVYTVNSKTKTQQLYLDGVLAASNSYPGEINYSIGYDSFFMGVHPNQDRMFFQGKIDEVVVSEDSRSASWIKLCYENQHPEGQASAEIVFQ